MVSATEAIPKGQLRSFLEPYAVRQKQLDGLVAFLRAVAWQAAGRDARELDDGTVVIHTTTPQLVRAMGLPNGPTIRDTQNRWRKQVYRWVRYCEPLGISAHEAPRGPRGQGTGILVRIPAGVAQSVRAAFKGVRRVAPGLARPSFWDEVPAPPSGLQGRPCPAVESDQDSNDGAGARADAPVQNRASPGPAALSGPGNGCQPGEVASAAIEAWRANTRKPHRLSARGVKQLDRYGRLLDAAIRPGYSARWLADGIADAFDPEQLPPALGRLPWDRAAPHGQRPRSLGMFVRLLRRKWRQVRRERRIARRRRPAPRPNKIDRLPRRQVVDVAGGGGEVGVTEELLNDVQRGALPGELGRERVPQPVRVNPLVEAGADGGVLEGLPDAARVHRLPEGRLGDDAEQMFAPREPQSSPAVLPALDDGAGLGVDGDDAPALALPLQDGDGPGLEVNVLGIEREGLGDAEAAAPQNDDDRPVSIAGVPPAHGGHQPVYLIPGEDFGRESPAGVSGPHSFTVARQGDE